MFVPKFKCKFLFQLRDNVQCIQCVLESLCKGNNAPSFMSPVSIPCQEFGWEEHLRNDLFCVKWD